MVFWQLRFQSCKIVKVVKPKKITFITNCESCEISKSRNIFLITICQTRKSGFS